MCHDIILSFPVCSHTIKSGVFECGEYFRNGNKHCDPKNEPKQLIIQGKCIDCRTAESDEAVAEIERAMEASRLEREAQMQQQEQDEEKEFRAALEASLDVPPVRPPAFDEDELSKAIQASLRVPDHQTSQTKEYLWLAYNYLGCGHTVRAYKTAIERNADQPEEMVEEALGGCPDCRGEGSSAAAARAILRPGMEDVDDPVPAYDQLVTSSPAPRSHDPLPGQSSMCSIPRTSARDHNVAGTGTTLPRQGSQSDTDRAHDTGQIEVSDNGSTSAAGATSGPRSLYSMRSTSPINTPRISTQTGSEPDEYDEDYESDDEFSRRAIINRSTASRLFLHGDHNQPRYKGDPNNELGALAEEDEDEGIPPAPTAGDRR